MQQREATLIGSTGDRIYYQVWEPETSPRAMLMVAHGFGEHGGRYSHVAEFFTRRGFALAALDHYGHGRSEGIPGYVPKFDHFTDTLELLRQQLRTDFPVLPFYLLGHSMGGLISTQYLLRFQHQLDGCALSGPALYSEVVPGGAQLLLLKLLSLLVPKMGIFGLEGSEVSRDEAVVKAYFDDPLVYNGKLTARLTTELFTAMGASLERASEITLPMLIMHGAADSMASPEGSQRLHQNLASADKQLNIYPGLYHEIFNEPEQDQVMGDLADWLEQRLTAA